MANAYPLLVALVFLAVDPKVDASKMIMKDLSVKFGKPMDECIKEENIPDTTATDFYDYWKMDYEITNRNFGCLISCLAKKWNIHHPDGKIHKDNAADFAKQYGADEAMALKLIDIIHDCEKKISEDDECVRVLGISNCFKVEVHKLDWAPPAELVAEELMADL